MQHESGVGSLVRQRTPQPSAVAVGPRTMNPTVYQGLKPQFFRLQWLAEHVMGVSFHHPPVNAFHTAMWTEMHRIFSHIRGDGHVRAVVLYGEGKCFTGGLDRMYVQLTQCVTLF